MWGRGDSAVEGGDRAHDAGDVRGRDVVAVQHLEHRGHREPHGLRVRLHHLLAAPLRDVDDAADVFSETNLPTDIHNATPNFAIFLQTTPLE